MTLLLERPTTEFKECTEVANLVSLTRQHAEEATDVLANAFVNDPLMRYVFQEQLTPQDYRLREIFNFACEVRFDLDWPLMGIVEGCKVLGVAGIDEPGFKDWPISLMETLSMLKMSMGEEAFERLESYAGIPDAYRPREPHYFLGVIGVHPEAQGRGYARKLLDTLHQMSESHPTSTGVALDTENPRNVSIYSHFGYEVIGETSLDDLTVWTMFRPNNA